VTKTLKTTFEDSGAQLDTYVLHAFKWLHKFDKITRSTGNGQNPVKWKSADIQLVASLPALKI